MGGGDPTGGSLELANLIDKYGEVLLPDLKHYYGIDLRDLFSEVSPLSPSFVLAHIRYLPLESAFVAAQRGGQQFRGWDEGRYMLATLINAVRLNTYVFTLAHIDSKSKQPDPPDMYPIPDNVKARTKPAPKPGSFAFIVNSKMASIKKRKEGGTTDAGRTRGT